jgi:hypothetical protein
MRNNLLCLSGTELMGVGAVHGPGVYFSDALVTANSYARASTQFDVAPMFVLEAAGRPGTWEKTPTICTSLFPSQHHSAVSSRSSRPSPHASLVVRGIYMDSARSGSPAVSSTARSYFEKAQELYAAEVGTPEWGHISSGVLEIISPKWGFSCSAVRQ